MNTALFFAFITVACAAIARFCHNRDMTIARNCYIGLTVFDFLMFIHHLTNQL
jgi:hypothetical protein